MDNAAEASRHLRNADMTTQQSETPRYPTNRTTRLAKCSIDRAIKCLQEARAELTSITDKEFAARRDQESRHELCLGMCDETRRLRCGAATSCSVGASKRQRLENAGGLLSAAESAAGMAAGRIGQAHRVGIFGPEWAELAQDYLHTDSCDDNDIVDETPNDDAGPSPPKTVQEEADPEPEEEVADAARPSSSNDQKMPEGEEEIADEAARVVKGSGLQPMIRWRPNLFGLF